MYLDYVLRRFGVMLVTAVGVAVTTSLIGVYLSFFLDSAPAPTIVLLLTTGFGAAFVVSARTARVPG